MPTQMKCLKIAQKASGTIDFARRVQRVQMVALQSNRHIGLNL